MDISLKNNLITITTDFKTLNQKWVIEFLNNHAKDMLFLQRAVLIFKNDLLKDSREEFLIEVVNHHQKKFEFNIEFFKKSLLKVGNYPIKIELKKGYEQEVVNVKLYAYDKKTVLITLDKPNSWVMTYFRSQLNVYSEKGTDISMVLDLSSFRAKERFDRTLNKRHILHYNIQYTYDSKFLTNLYSDYTSYTFGDLCYEDDNQDKIKYYTILECPIGASLDAIKKSYKKLVKIYHPDKIIHEKPYMVEHYTKKFQLLQEAYETLRIVS